MSNIDKQALREAAEKATQGPWEMEQENIWFTDKDGYTKHLAYVEQGDDVDDKQDHYNTAYIAAANPAIMLALLDENIQLHREKDAIEAVALALRDDMRQAREQLEAAERRKADNQEPAGYHVIKECGKVGCSVATLEEAEKTRDFWNKKWTIRPYFYTAQPASERERIRREHAEWSDATFGDVGPVGPLKHLSKEALEAAADPSDPLE
ncbi:DUF550 domain-containing protein, partial [Salmonella enterica]|nr:DUF550 domain-containing protein [Salmonella enterica]